MTEFDAEAPRPGLAAERTDLAWNRSGLALLGCGAVVLRGVVSAHPETGRAAVGTFILALGAVIWGLGAWHSRRRVRPGHARTVATPGDLLPLSLGVAAVGVAAFFIGAFFPG